MIGKSNPEKIADGDNVLIHYPGIGTLWLCDVEVRHDDDGAPYWIEGYAEDRSIPEGKSWMNFPITCVWKRSQDLRDTDREGEDDG